jgi:hypothetical protein
MTFLRCPLPSSSWSRWAPRKPVSFPYADVGSANSCVIHPDKHIVLARQLRNFSIGQIGGWWPM